MLLYVFVILQLLQHKDGVVTALSMIDEVLQDGLAPFALAAVLKSRAYGEQLLHLLMNVLLELAHATSIVLDNLGR